MARADYIEDTLLATRDTKDTINRVRDLRKRHIKG